MLREMFAVVRHLKSARGRVDFQRISETEFAELVVMAVRFTVGRDIDQTCCATRRSSSRETLDELRAGSQRLLESDRLREFRIVEEHGQGTSGTVAMEIVVGDAGVD